VDRRREAQRAAALGDGALLSECRLEFFVAGGPGGQHRNKAATGVRLLHPATGVKATATERRSQARNRGVALLRLRRRLEALAHVPAPRLATRPTPASARRRLAAKRRRGEAKVQRREPPLTHE
jgi:protein subunit release factor B